MSIYWNHKSRTVRCILVFVNGNITAKWLIYVTMSSDGFNSVVLLSFNWFYVSWAINDVFALYMSIQDVFNQKTHCHQLLWALILNPPETNDKQHEWNERPETVHTKQPRFSVCVERHPSIKHMNGMFVCVMGIKMDLVHNSGFVHSFQHLLVQRLYLTAWIAAEMKTLSQKCVFNLIAEW